MKQSNLIRKSVINMVAFTVVMAMFVSCNGSGGGSSLPKNEYLGNMPAASAEYLAAKADLKEREKKIDISKMKQEDILKKMTEFMEEEKAIEAKIDQAVASAEEELADKEIPIVNENPAVEVMNMGIYSIGREIVTFEGTVEVKEALPVNSDLPFLMTDKDGNVIHEGDANMIVPYEFGRTEIQPNDYVVRASIDMKNPESAKLARIVFK